MTPLRGIALALTIASAACAPPAPRVRAWSSPDGRAWQPQPALTMTGTAIDQLAARGSTIVGIGADSSGGAAVWRSTDGAAWTRGDPPSADAVVRAVATVSDGFL